MNAVLEQWLNLRNMEESKKRDQHLIELGLVDETKKVRVYTKSKSGKDSQWDEARKAYFTEEPTAIEVTPEEYADILHHESLMEVEEEEAPRLHGSNGASTILIILSVIHFIAGIVGAFLWADGDMNYQTKLIVMGVCLGGFVFGFVYIALANTLKLHFKLLQQIEINTRK